MTDAPLDSVLDVRTRTRRATQIGWIPLTVFTVVVLGAVGVALTRPRPSVGPRSAWQGLPLYWLIALPVAYIACGALVELRARRVGVRSALSAYVVGGIALVGAYVVATVTGLFGAMADFTVRGTGPTVSIGLALFVLAAVQRSRSLLLSAVVVTAAGLTASLYNLENLTYRLGLPYTSVSGQISNELFLAVVLALCAAAVGYVTRRASTR